MSLTNRKIRSRKYWPNMNKHSKPPTPTILNSILLYARICANFAIASQCNASKKNKIKRQSCSLSKVKNYAKIATTLSEKQSPTITKPATIGESEKQKNHLKS